MNKFWPKLLISQLFLAVCLINLITALTHDDSRPLTVENIAADRSEERRVGKEC